MDSAAEESKRFEDAFDMRVGAAIIFEKQPLAGGRILPGELLGKLPDEEQLAFIIGIKRFAHVPTAPKESASTGWHAFAAFVDSRTKGSNGRESMARRPNFLYCGPKSSFADLQLPPLQQRDGIVAYQEKLRPHALHGSTLRRLPVGRAAQLDLGVFVSVRAGIKVRQEDVPFRVGRFEPGGSQITSRGKRGLLRAINSTCSSGTQK